MSDDKNTDEPYEWKVPERNRGVLTERERRYLLGQLELDGQDERNIRYQIRQRTIESLRDLILISSNLEDRDLERILESVDSLVVASALSYIAYRGLDESLIEESKGMTGGRVTDFEYILMERIESAEGRIEESKGIANIDVDIDIDRAAIDEEEILQKLKAHEATQREFNLWYSRHSYDELAEIDETLGYKTPEGDTVVFNSPLDSIK